MNYFTSERVAENTAAFSLKVDISISDIFPAIKPPPEIDG